MQVSNLFIIIIIIISSSSSSSSSSISCFLFVGVNHVNCLVTLSSSCFINMIIIYFLISAVNCYTVHC